MIDFIKLHEASSRNTGPNLHLFVLDWMHFSCWIQIWQWTFEFLKFLGKKFGKMTCHKNFTSMWRVFRVNCQAQVLIWDQFELQINHPICDPSQQNRAVVCYQEKCDIPFIWKNILLTQRWYHSCVNWMQHCNFMVKNNSLISFIYYVFSHTNGVISWNAFYRQLPCFDVMGHI